MLPPRSITWSLPDWIFRDLDLDSSRETDEDKMLLSIELAQRNVEHGGGPFGAVIFDVQTGQVVAPGVNLVMPQGCSLLHAEMVAIAFAQAGVASYSLDASRHQLFASSEPCVQCLGAIYWSGVGRLVCGASIESAIEAGFDEGPRSLDWKEQLASRGIALRDGVLRAPASSVLSEFRRRGGIIYNARRTSTE